MSSELPSISANTFAYLVLVLIVLGTLVILIALSASRRTRAKLRLPWGMGFELDAERDSSPRPEAPRRPASSKSRKPQLSKRTWLETKGGKWQYTLGGKPKYILGRSSNSDIRLSDPACSSKHAVIFKHGSKYRIRNLSRTGGTTVNGRPVREQNLGNGNKIRLGNTVLIFRVEK